MAGSRIMAENPDKKLIIDDDWKKEAQTEKDKLAKEEEAEEKGGRAADARHAQMPEADFSGLVSMLATQAFFALGLIRLKGEPETPPDLEAAKFNIDMLIMLEEKTKGNLSAEETALLDQTLHQLRLAFVQLSKV
jgi:hypothetical protein